MKLTAIIVLMGCLHVSATSFAQSISLSEKDAPLEKVFKEIERQSGYVFFCNDEWLARAKPVTIQLQQVDLITALNACFQQQSLIYTIVGKNIVVQIKPPANENAILTSPPGEIHGEIVDAQGTPLANAYLVVKRTKYGTTTDAKGKFTLKNVRPDDIITVSFVGYRSLSFKPGDPHDGESYTKVLQVADNSLDHVVVQGYGNTSQRYATGDIGVVSSEEIEKQPVMNPLLALQGRVAGLDIQQTSGYASGPIKAELRGKSTIADLAADPLYIIDGVPLTVVSVGAAQGYGAGSAGFLQNAGLAGPAQGQSPLFSINPSDIESIAVLKDADATSIYGSRGANGVILITTKAGKVGKTQFNLHVDEGVSKITRFWKLLNTPQYLAMRREAFRNDGLAPDAGSAPDLFLWDTTRYTDWQKAIYGRAGKVTNIQAELTGGDAHNTFRIAGAYTHAQEITTASGADQRGSVTFNMGHSSNNRKFRVSLVSSFSYTRSDMINIPGSITYAPDAPSIYDSLGRLNWKDWESSIGNPFGALLQPYSATTSFLNSSLLLSYQPVRGLTFKTSFGYNNAQSNQISLTPIASQDPKTQPVGSSSFGNNSNRNWIIEPQITYDIELGPGKLNALLGGSTQFNSTDGIYIHGSGYTSDALLRTISNAPSSQSHDNYGQYRYASIFGRVGYNLFDRYIVNLNARRDGSSNYGPGNQYGNFASVGWAWLFSEEPWLKGHLSILSFGKIRGSYGTTGNDGGIPYGYITRWAASGSAYDNVVPLAPIQHANPNYRWQQSKKLELAADMGFFKDWLTLTVAFYRTRTGNQLLPYPTPILSGFPSVIANLNALVQNQGWEFSIGGKGVHVHSKYFNWDWAPHFVFAVNQNKFLSFSGLGSSPFRNQGLIGHPLNGVYVLHYIGVNPQTGMYTYQDRNHDGVINPFLGPNTDAYFKKLSPSYSTGFGFNFDIKQFGISLFFVAKKQEGVNAIAQGNNPGTFNYNQPVEVLARWQKPGDVTSVGKFSTIGAQDPSGYLGSSDIGYTDASYVRLQTLSLSYSLPERLTKTSGFHCSIFINANDLLTFTGYKGIDPETQSYGGMPPSKTIVGGLSFNF